MQSMPPALTESYTPLFWPNWLTANPPLSHIQYLLTQLTGIFEQYAVMYLSSRRWWDYWNGKRFFLLV